MAVASACASWRWSAERGEREAGRGQCRKGQRAAVVNPTRREPTAAIARQRHAQDGPADPMRCRKGTHKPAIKSYRENVSWRLKFDRRACLQVLSNALTQHARPLAQPMNDPQRPVSAGALTDESSLKAIQLRLGTLVRSIDVGRVVDAAPSLPTSVAYRHHNISLAWTACRD